MENFNDKIKEKLNSYARNLKDAFSKTVNNIKNIDLNNITSEKNLKIGLSVVAITLVAVATYTKTVAYDIHIHGESLGIVRGKDTVDKSVKELEEELSKLYKMEIVLGDDIEVKKTNVFDGKITSQDDIKKQLKNKVNFLVKAYSVEVDGKQLGALETKKEVEEVIEEVKRPYEEEVEKNGKLESIELLEDVVVKKEDIPVYKMKDKEAMVKAIKEGGVDTKIHTVEVGETLWTIAKMYDTTMEELIEANPDGDPDKLQIGDEVKLIKTKPLLTVATVSNTTYEEVVKFESEVELNDSMYDNEKEVKVAGKEGKNKVVAKEVKHNGVLISKNVIEEKVMEKPVRELVVVGTKEVPKTRATGTLAMATRGRISSRYGSRNGRMHKGLDIAASMGSPIYAADGGKVVSAGWSGNYGYLVEIDHENGMRTKYAHCSKLLVSAGDRVYKGQEIAKVGNTGRSTGPHLHIEVLKNGSNVNPSAYLN